MAPAAGIAWSSLVLVLTAAHPDAPARDMELSAELLEAVAAGVPRPVARVFRPGPTLSFGKLDELRPGYAEAAAAAVRLGFTPVRRLGGGQAAAYDTGSLVVEVIVPQHDIVQGTEQRFAALTGLIVQALRTLRVPAAEGELPGEYCPGRFSVHAEGVKVAGVAQRSVRGASLVTAFVAVHGGDALRGVLLPVYAALGRPWDPATAGAADDVADVELDDVEAELVRRLEATTAFG
ncbi:MAG: lipoate--protein ligase family protein [Thermoleophilia bacterium]|nr:lipoate--protein ligase family protein [Thermoleophilia bacterium]